MSQPLLPPQSPKSKGKFTIVLDLDETLVHVTHQKRPCQDFDFELEQRRYYVYIRPYAELFIEKLAEKCEVVIYTASCENYAKEIMKRLDPKNLCKHILSREHTRHVYGVQYAKPLTLLGRALSRSLLIDNSPDAIFVNPYNTIPVPDYLGNKRDCVLIAVLEDVEKIVQQIYGKETQTNGKVKTIFDCLVDLVYA